ncbi:hypothetical protein [Vogesella indigofera]|uniref:hypothetical protein n=1 Tax=Vogesella indigofera TaxID=45465 RepID=UPI00234DDAAC|nr:hypothetical protein [Vogesella indigofera]MDC7705843.1 hypothetical protein [Vogesella indigofera]
MLTRLLSLFRADRPGRLAVQPKAASRFAWLLLAGHGAPLTPIAEGHDLLALVDGANHIELALQLHCTF